MRSRGFTLIEVLVALAIVTVGMAAVLGAMTSAADTAFYLRDRTFAEWVALNRIAEVRLQAKLPSKGKTKGEVDFAERKWVWEQEVKDLQYNMLRIEVSVRPTEIAESKKNAWYATVDGVVGDAVNYQPGNPPLWEIDKAIITIPGGGS